MTRPFKDSITGTFADSIHGSLFLVILGWSLIVSLQGYSQSPLSDTAFVADATQRAAALYDKSFPKSALLFTGPNYVERIRDRDHHPFFKDEYYAKGMVVIDGRPVYGLYLKYECVSDLLLLDAGAGDLEVIQERIDEFEIAGERFIRLTKDSPYGATLATGYYHLLHGGDEVVVLAKRKKVYREMIENMELHRIFLVRDTYYIAYRGQVYQVTGKASVLKVFSEEKGALKRFIKSAGLDFRGNFDFSLVAVVKRFEELSRETKDEMP